MHKKLMSYLILILVVSFVFTSALFAQSISDSLGSDESSCNLMKLEEVFEAEDGSDGNAVGEYAKDFSYSCQDGSIHKLSDFRGKKVVLMKFWAKFCYYCKESLPEFDDLHNKYKDDGLLVLAMNLQDSVSDVLQLVENYTFANIYSAYPYYLAGYDAIPLNAMIDKDGVLQFIELGALPGNEEIEALLNKLEPQPEPEPEPQPEPQPPVSDESSCDLMKLEEIFDAEDGNDGNAVGEFAKDFSYSCQDGSMHKLSDFRGEKVVLMKFWAKFCYYCKESLPVFDDLHNKYKDDGLLVLAMNLQDSVSDVLQLVENYTFANIYSAYPYYLAGYDAIPLNAMIDKDGVFQFIELGALPTNEEIEALLNELKPQLKPQPQPNPGINWPWSF